jgi:chromosome partitioning protein
MYPKEKEMKKGVKEEMKIFTLANLKGGTGKSTLTFGISTWLANDGYKVLVIDSDMQSNLTRNFGIDNVRKKRVKNHQRHL